MRLPRSPLVTFAVLACAAAAVLVCVAGAVLLGRLTGHGAPTERDRGALTQAVVDWHTHQGTPHTTIAADAAHQAVVGPSSVTWYDATGAEYQTPVDTPDQVVRLFDDNAYSDWRQETGGGAAFAVSMLPALLILAIVGLAVWQLRRGGAPGLSMGRSRARVIEGAARPETRFTDVAGVDTAKVELVEIVDFLRRPERYRAMGARIPRGVLLAGPPGTGKTLLARAVAGEAGVPFLALSGSEFVEMFVGVGASRVRSLFAQARRLSPSIVFVDEIDAVGRRRGNGHGHANDEREQTLNQLLVEMDGFDSDTPVIVIAATNRADVLDPALLRPGRFDRHVSVDSPDLAGRAAILEVHGRGKPVSTDVDWRVLARQTPGFSGADLANVLNEAALLAARNDADAIAQDHLEEATARVVAGPRRESRLMTPRETRVIAYHEMGHALVYHVLPGTDPVHRVSIVSRGRALGWTMTVSETDRVLGSRAQLVDQLAGLLGGRCAEELVFGATEVTTGAQDDIERATRLARRMVTEWGMSPLGLRAFPDAEPGVARPHAESTAAAVDAEVDRLLEDAGRRARRVLADRRELLDRLALRLLQTETMDGDELAAMVAADPAGALPAPPAAPPAERDGGAPIPAWVEVRTPAPPDVPGLLPTPRRGLGRRAAGIAAAVRTALATRPTTQP